MATATATTLSPVRKGHPRALYVLFFTEMWERFGYYLMVGIFFLYLTDSLAHGGKGFDNTSAADLVGSYIALVYLSPFIGGLIADRYIGYRRAIIIGGTLMAIGYFGLALAGTATMYIALLCIVIGNGFFKPNISTILGNIYNAEDLKPKKDVAYNIFYMGINIGAFFCNFVAAYLQIKYGWPYAFSAAGVGMILGLIWFLAGMKHVKAGDVIKPVQKEDYPLSKIFGYVFLPAIVVGTLAWNISAFTGSPVFGTKSNDAFLFACIPIIIFYIGIFLRANKEDKRGLGALLAFFGVSLVFWVIYNQNSTALTIWAQTYTERSVSPTVANIAEPFGQLQSVTTDSQMVTKIDPYFRAQLDANGNTIQTMGIDPYFQNLPKDQWPPPGQPLKLVAPELYQSVNPFFIVLFTPLLVGLFVLLRKRNREPSTPLKSAIGMFIAGFSSLLMVFAVMSTNIYIDKPVMMWLIGTYAIFTIGELLISPIGLSLVSKLAPPRLTALFFGAWFLIISISGKISGLMATYWDNFTDKKEYFMILFIAAVIAGIVMLMITKWIRGVIREKTGMD